MGMLGAQGWQVEVVLGSSPVRGTLGAVCLDARRHFRVRKVCGAGGDVKDGAAFCGGDLLRPAAFAAAGTAENQGQFCGHTFVKSTSRVVISEN